MMIIPGLVLATGGGLAAGGWGWLVAGGFAPIILAALPCAVTCGLGLGLLGMSAGRNRQSRLSSARLPKDGDGSCCGADLAPLQASPSIHHRQNQNAI